MYKIDGTTITLTRGDSFYCQLSLTRGGKTYTPDPSDTIRFALKKDYFDTEALITKTIPNDTLVLSLLPADTKTLAFGTYVYDIEITFADGDVDTFINEAIFTLAPEVI